jgi:hypothetical protein
LSGSDKNRRITGRFGEKMFFSLTAPLFLDKILKSQLEIRSLSEARYSDRSACRAEARRTAGSNAENRDAVATSVALLIELEAQVL